MRELAKITARLKGGSYDGVMIIKTVWERVECESNHEPVIIKENKRMLVCQACHDNKRLSTTMLHNPAREAIEPIPELTSAWQKMSGRCTKNVHLPVNLRFFLYFP